MSSEHKGEFYKQVELEEKKRRVSIDPLTDHFIPYCKGLLLATGRLHLDIDNIDNVLGKYGHMRNKIMTNATTYFKAEGFNVKIDVDDDSHIVYLTAIRVTLKDESNSDSK
jgi:hypothetical protein